MGIRIDVELFQGKAKKGLSDLSKALDRIDGQLNRIGGGMSGVAKGAKGGNTPAQLARTRRMPAAKQGPFQSVQDEIDFLLSPAGNAKYGYRAAKKASALHKMHNPDPPMDPYMAALMRTRFAKGMFGGLKAMPLGRDLMQFGGAMFNGGGMGGIGGGGGAMGGGMAGLAKMGGPIAIAVAGLILLAVTIKKVVDELGAGYRRLIELKNQSAGMGSNFGGNQTAVHLGKLIGNPGAASSFQNGISSGIGAGAAAQLGINPIGGPFGDNDYAKKMQIYAKAVANAPTYNEARRMAEKVGMPELASLHLLDPNNKRNAFSNNKAFRTSENDIRTAANWEAKMANIQGLWERFWEKLSATAMRWWYPILDGAEKLFMTWGRIWDWFIDLINRLQDMLGLGKGDREQTTQEKNIRAIENNTRELKNVRETIGGGRRSRLNDRINGLNEEGMRWVRANAL